MGHLPKLIEDLALILMAGAIITLLFRRIKQPVVSGIVVGVERNKERILNPDSSLKLEWGDVIWIVGDKKRFSN